MLDPHHESLPPAVLCISWLDGSTSLDERVSARDHAHAARVTTKEDGATVAVSGCLQSKRLRISVPYPSPPLICLFPLTSAIAGRLVAVSGDTTPHMYLLTNINY